jgi:hypothetical protein
MTAFRITVIQAYPEHYKYHPPGFRHITIQNRFLTICSYKKIQFKRCNDGRESSAANTGNYRGTVLL